MSKFSLAVLALILGSQSLNSPADDLDFWKRPSLNPGCPTWLDPNRASLRWSCRSAETPKGYPSDYRTAVQIFNLKTKNPDNSDNCYLGVEVFHFREDGPGHQSLFSELNVAASSSGNDWEYTAPPSISVMDFEMRLNPTSKKGKVVFTVAGQSYDLNVTCFWPACHFLADPREDCFPQK